MPFLVFAHLLKVLLRHKVTEGTEHRRKFSKSVPPVEISQRLHDGIPFGFGAGVPYGIIEFLIGNINRRFHDSIIGEIRFQLQGVKNTGKAIVSV